MRGNLFSGEVGLSDSCLGENNSLYLPPLPFLVRVSQGQKVKVKKHHRDKIKNQTDRGVTFPHSSKKKKCLKLFFEIKICCGQFRTEDIDMKKSVGVCWEGSRLQTHGNMYTYAWAYKEYSNFNKFITL